MKKLFILVLIPIVFLSSESGKNKKPVNKPVERWKKIVSSDARRKGIRVVPEEEIGEWRSSRRVAIVVGVSGYPYESGLSALNFGASDSKKMALSLEQAGGFDRVVLLNDDTGKENPSLLPKRENILEQYENILSEEPHLVLFYFSGHGFQNKGRNAITAMDTVIARGASKASETEGAKKNAEIQEIAKNIIYIDDLITKAQEKKITQTLFFLDACREKLREGAKAGAGEQFGKLPAEVESAKGVGVFMGTAPGGYSYETRELDGGVFTHYLIEGLMGGVQDENPGKAEYVTFGALKDYVEKKVKTYSKKKKNREQIPYTAGDYTGNFLITATRPKGKIRSEILSFQVDGKEKPELARVLFDTNDNPVQMQFFEEGEGEKFIPGDNAEGISKILYKITDREYSTIQFHIDGKPAGETYFRILGDGWEVKRKEGDEFEITVYNRRGYAVLKEKYESKGKLKDRKIIKYDENCLKVSKYEELCKMLEEDYSQDGKLRERTITKYDDNCLKELERGDFCKTVVEIQAAQGKLVRRTVFSYDGKWNEILKVSTGSNGNITVDSNGIARYVRKYNEICNKNQDCIELEETYGENNSLKEGQSGIARSLYKYDENCLRLQPGTIGSDGCRIQESYYGEDGNLKERENGIARSIYRYDENCLNTKKNSFYCRILQEYYREDGNLKESQNGIARYINKYDEKGNKILEEHYGEDGKLKEDSDGIARWIFKYDLNCLKVEKGLNECVDSEKTYGTDGRFLYLRKYNYDEKGNKILEERYGEDGKLKEDSAGIASYVYKYDEKRNVILGEHYGADGKLKEYSYGIARYLYKYDEKGKTILEEHYGADGKLKENSNGIARFVYKYDEKGNMIFKELYEAGSMVRYLTKYDEKGNRILKERYGADGKLKEDSDGIAQWITKYNLDCLNAVKSSYECLDLTETYGANGIRKGNNEGIAIYKYAYDINCIKFENPGNCRTMEEFYGEDGKLKGKDGIARITVNYNTKGYKISSTSFSAAGSIVEKKLSPVYYHPSIPDKVLQLNLDELFRPEEVKLEDAKKD